MSPEDAWETTEWELLEYARQFEERERRDHSKRSWALAYILYAISGNEKDTVEKIYRKLVSDFQGLTKPTIAERRAARQAKCQAKK